MQIRERDPWLNIDLSTYIAKVILLEQNEAMEAETAWPALAAGLARLGTLKAGCLRLVAGLGRGPQLSTVGWLFSLPRPH